MDGAGRTGIADQSNDDVIIGCDNAGGASLVRPNVFISDQFCTTFSLTGISRIEKILFEIEMIVIYLIDCSGSKPPYSRLNIYTEPALFQINMLAKPMKELASKSAAC